MPSSGTQPPATPPQDGSISRMRSGTNHSRPRKPFCTPRCISCRSRGTSASATATTSLPQMSCGMSCSAQKVVIWRMPATARAALSEPGAYSSPACNTPLLWPLWWDPTVASFSRTTTAASGRASSSLYAAANPTMPAPTTATSCVRAGAGCRVRPGASGIEEGLVGIKRLSITLARPRLDTAQSEQPVEGIRRKPALGPLGGEHREEVADLGAARGPRQRDVQVGAAEVAVVFRHFVLQHQVVAERVPGQVGYDAMVLVAIGAEVREDDVRCDLRLEGLEAFLDFGERGGEETGPKAGPPAALPAPPPQNPPGAARPLGLAQPAAPAEHDPAARDPPPRGEREQRPAAPDLDIVRV